MASHFFCVCFYGLRIHACLAHSVCRPMLVPVLAPPSLSVVVGILCAGIRDKIRDDLRMRGSYPRFHALPKVHDGRYCRRCHMWCVSMWRASKQAWLREREIPCLCVSSGVGVLPFAPLQSCVPCASFIASSRGSSEAMLPFLIAASGANAVNFLGDIVSDTSRCLGGYACRYM